MKEKLSNNTFYFWLVAVPFMMWFTPSPEPVVGMDDRVKPYVERFEDYGKYTYADGSYKIPEMKIAVRPLDNFNILLIGSGALGYCSWLSKTIVIKEKFWKNASDVEKEMVVFHELGHCALDRLHKSVTDPWGDQISVMFPRIFNPTLYKDNREYYVDELFNPY